MSLCPKKGIEPRDCIYRDPFCGCEGCLVGTNVRTLYICLECGAGFYEVSDYEKKLRCPECGSIVDCCVLDDEEDVWTVLKEHYEQCVRELKKRWKHPSKNPLGIHLRDNQDAYVKLSFGRLDGWEGVEDTDFELSDQEAEQVFREYIDYIKEFEDETQELP